jgi:uncharacterized protein YraI
MVAAPGFSSAASPSAQPPQPLVLAFYYAWYDLNTWQSGTVPDVPQELYASRDTASMARQVDQAKGAGIDAFIVSWYGPQTKDNQTETNLGQLLDIAAARGFSAAVDFETQGPFFPDKTSVIDALQYLLTTHAEHPAYLRYQGKPVVFFWRQQRFSVAEWQEIRAAVDPNHQAIWIAEGIDINYQDVFDGHHLYSIAWSPDVKHTLRDWASRVRRYEDQHGTDRLWVATVMPGYDDTGTTRSDAFSVDRRQGDYYRETWTAARESTPDWVIITSFNEWVEGTAIEPGTQSGDLYLNITREEAALYKRGEVEATETSSTAEPEAAPEAGQSPPDETEPMVTADETVRIRSGPNTDYARLGRLLKGKQAVVIGRSADGEWWQIEVLPSINADGKAWVTAEYTSFSGEMDEVPVLEDVTPADSSPPTATTAPTLPSSTSTPRATATPAVPTGNIAAAPSSTPRTLKPTTKWPGSILATLTPSATPTSETSRQAIALAATPTGTRSSDVSPTAPSPSPTSPVRTEIVTRDSQTSAVLWLGIGSVMTALAIGATIGYSRKNRHPHRRR